MRTRRSSDERGASAVEFALVSVILFPLLFGMLQYGLLFNDFLQVRQGVRQGARTGVVQNLPPSCSGTTAEKIACVTKSQIAPVTGTIAVHVATPAASPAWKVGNPLLVCAVVHSAGSVGLIPVPDSGFVKAKTQMAIEQETPATSGFPAGDSDPTGASWSWCT